MKFSRKASVVYDEILGRQDQKVSSIFSEFVEILEALVKLDTAEARLEAQQFFYALQMQLYQATGIDFYLVGCGDAVEGFYKRRDVWLKIFAEYNVVFKNQYLRFGSNYKRAYKIKKALELAGVYIDTKEAVLLCERYFEA